MFPLHKFVTHRWARSMLEQSLLLWFVLDTGISLALAYSTHALFDVPLLLPSGFSC